MRKRKAQAAFEFLTTYGWAFMLLLVMIGALTYFGVLSGEALLPDKCTFQPGISCQDFSASQGSPGNVRIILINNIGKTIAIQDVAISCDPSVTCIPPADKFYNLNVSMTTRTSVPFWKSDEAREMWINASGFTSSKTRVGIEIQFISSGEYFTKNITGEIIVTPT